MKYFELEIPFRKDIAHGNLWKIFAKTLLTFNFKFYAIPNHISLSHIRQMLDSFRTSFWLEEKHWFVGYLNNCFFSIPYFTPDHIASSELSYFYSTTSDHSIIFNHLNKFTINTDTIKKTNHHFTHIKTLVIKRSILLKTLASVIDLNQIEHLVVLSLNELSTLLPMNKKLNKLTIKNNITIDMIEQVRCYRFEQIHELEIRITNEYRDYIIEELFRLFPNVEYLTYKSTIESTGMMIRLIKGFNHLLNASFHADCSFVRKEEKFCRNPQLIIENILGNTYRNTTCRVYHSINTQIPLSIHWQIQKKV